MVKFGVYSNIKAMILVLDHPTCIALPFIYFYSFSGGDNVKMQRKLSKIPLTDLRINMFKSLTDNNLRRLSPSRRALEQHFRRACYQTCYTQKESVSDILL